MKQHLEELSVPEIESLWLEEAEWRDRALDTGALSSIPAEDVLKEARARLAGEVPGADGPG
jgi:hypothetical protein